MLAEENSIDWSTYFMIGGELRAPMRMLYNSIEIVLCLSIFHFKPHNTPPTVQFRGGRNIESLLH